MLHVDRHRLGSTVARARLRILIDHRAHHGSGRLLQAMDLEPETFPTERVSSVVYVQPTDVGHSRAAPRSRSRSLPLKQLAWVDVGEEGREEVLDRARDVAQHPRPPRGVYGPPPRHHGVDVVVLAAIRGQTANPRTSATTSKSAVIPTRRALCPASAASGSNSSRSRSVSRSRFMRIRYPEGRRWHLGRKSRLQPRERQFPGLDRSDQAVSLPACRDPRERRLRRVEVDCPRLRRFRRDHQPAAARSCPRAA
jgi:hypothetical protein